MRSDKNLIVLHLNGCRLFDLLLSFFRQSEKSFHANKPYFQMRISFRSDFFSGVIMDL